MARSSIWKFKIGLPDPDDEKKTVTCEKKAELVGGDHTAASARDLLLQLHFPHAKWMSVPERVTGEDLAKAKADNPVRQRAMAMAMNTKEGRELRATVPTSPQGKKLGEDDKVDEEDVGNQSETTIPRVPTEPPEE